MKKSIQVIMALMMFLAITAVITVSCKKDKDDETKPNPTISFKKDAGYTYASLTAKYNDTIKVGVIGKYNGSDNITKFKLTANGQTMLDSSFSGVIEFNADYRIIKGLAAKESWVFTITDVAGKTATDSIVITRSTEINSFASVILGAQSNTTVGGFYSTSNNTVYTLDDAFNNQSLIDVLCWFETASGNNTAIASPGANITGIFTGPHAPENWTVKNTTYYVKTNLTASDFDAISSDEAIIPAFVQTSAYRKAKNLAVGEVYSFKTQSGKYGMFKVKAVTPNADGSVEIAVKIQK